MPSARAWGRLFGAAEREIGVLVYSGLFLAEDAEVQKSLADKARAGVRVRILLGDPDSKQVAERGRDEGVDDAMSARIRNALGQLRCRRRRDPNSCSSEEDLAVPVNPQVHVHGSGVWGS